MLFPPPFNITCFKDAQNFIFKKKSCWTSKNENALIHINRFNVTDKDKSLFLRSLVFVSPLLAIGILFSLFQAMKTSGVEKEREEILQTESWGEEEDVLRLN